MMQLWLKQVREVLFHTRVHECAIRSSYCQSIVSVLACQSIYWNSKQDFDMTEVSGLVGEENAE